MRRYVSGLYGKKVLWFNGSSYVEHLFVGLNGFCSFSVEMLVKVPEPPSIRYWYWAYGYSLQNKGFHILWNKQYGYWQIGWWSGVQNQPTDPHWGEILHIVAVNDAENRLLSTYFNGELVDQDDLTGNEDLQEVNMRHIGKAIFTAENSLKGNVYLFRLYNRVLSKDKIRRLKNDAFSLRPASIRDGLVLEYIPDTLDCSAGIWRDNSGNNNNGTIYGAKCIAI